MDVLKLVVYKARDLQLFMAVINQFEAAGVTDIRFVRQKIEQHLTKENGSARIMRMKEAKNMPKQNKELCPSCGKYYLQLIASLEGLNRIGCRCGYSQVVSK